MEELCKRYWKPLWKFVSWEFSLAPEDAEDAVQGFLEGVLLKGAISQADRTRGKFRTFLFQAIKSHVLHERDKRQALKRGGGREMVAATLPGELESLAGQTLRAPKGLSAEQAADREWAKATLRQALKQLHAEYEKRGQGQRCAHLQEAVLAGEARVDCIKLAVVLAMSEGQASVEVHRFRKRLREAFLLQVRDTVVREEEAEESSYLLGLLAWG
jgi:RNA polymerase sigma factor (sigma-70 family)